MIKDLKVQIASDIDYENLIAEIYKKDQLIAIVSKKLVLKNWLLNFLNLLIRQPKRTLIG